MMNGEELPGVLVLNQWLKDRGLSPTGFAKRHGMDDREVRKLVKGERRRISVEFASEIERATDGGVPMHLWVPTKGE